MKAKKVINESQLKNVKARNGGNNGGRKRGVMYRRNESRLNENVQRNENNGAGGES
jgi:hypothetical protein